MGQHMLCDLLFCPMYEKKFRLTSGLRPINKCGPHEAAKRLPNMGQIGSAAQNVWVVHIFCTDHSPLTAPTIACVSPLTQLEHYIPDPRQWLISVDIYRCPDRGSYCPHDSPDPYDPQECFKYRNNQWKLPAWGNIPSFPEWWRSRAASHHAPHVLYCSGACWKKAPSLSESETLSLPFLWPSQLVATATC